MIIEQGRLGHGDDVVVAVRETHRGGIQSYGVVVVRGNTCPFVFLLYQKSRNAAAFPSSFPSSSKNTTTVRVVFKARRHRIPILR